MATVFSERRSDLVVSARESPAEGVVALTLTDPSGARLPAWTPGAHIDVLLGDDLVRAVLAVRPAVRAEQLAHRGAARRIGPRWFAPGARHARGRAPPSPVRGPRNHFPLHASPRYIFIAGGIGITPILPMITMAEESGADWQLWYGGRSRTSMAFLADLDGATATG